MFCNNTSWYLMLFQWYKIQCRIVLRVIAKFWENAKYHIDYNFTKEFYNLTRYIKILSKYQDTKFVHDIGGRWLKNVTALAQHNCEPQSTTMYNEVLHITTIQIFSYLFLSGCILLACRSVRPWPMRFTGNRWKLQCHQQKMPRQASSSISCPLISKDLWTWWWEFLIMKMHYNIKTLSLHSLF